MSNGKTVDFLGNTEKLFEGMVKLANEQTSAQDEVIDIITTMCDSLQSATDIVSSEISAAITDLNRARSKTRLQLQRCLSKQAERFSDANLRTKLHRGKVCGDLRKLGQRFGNPLSKQAHGAQSVGDWLRSLFKRSSSMKRFVDDLYFDEGRYIDDFRDSLHKIIVQAEKSANKDDLNALRSDAQKLRTRLSVNRETIRNRMQKLQIASDKCIEEIH